MKIYLLFKILFIINLIKFINNQKLRKQEINYRGFESNNSQAIKFPDEFSEETVESMKDSLESILVHSSHIKSIDEFFDAFGIVVTSRLRGYSFAEQASCEPEIRTVELKRPESDTSSIFFPKCVRIARCGGCCGASHLLECVPTKISQKIVKRAQIRIKRSPNGKAVPEGLQHNVKLDVHEECKCQCKVQESDCNTFIHKYKPELCKCECLNTKDENECRRAGKTKLWDSGECRCKCSQTKLCSTGLFFSHETCRSQQFLILT